MVTTGFTVQTFASYSLFVASRARLTTTATGARARVGAATVATLTLLNLLRLEVLAKDHDIVDFVELSNSTWVEVLTL